MEELGYSRLLGRRQLLILLALGATAAAWLVWVLALPVSAHPDLARFREPCRLQDEYTVCARYENGRWESVVRTDLRYDDATRRWKQVPGGKASQR